MTALTVGAALQDAAARLRAAGLDRPRLEAEVLLAHLLAGDRAGLWRAPEAALPPGVASRFADLCRRRARGEPAAYLIGVREFWSLPIQVDPRVLVPRPETEHLVEVVLESLAGGEAPVVDFGTGSGCVALALAHERPGLRLVAVDRDAGALAVAAGNARRLGLAGRILLLQAERLAALAPRPCLQAVVSNPPYIPAAEVDGLPVDVRRHEPRSALTPGPDGLEVTRLLIRDAAVRLLPGGLLAVEIHPDSRRRLLELLAAGPWDDVQVRADLAGRSRVVSARRRA